MSGQTKIGILTGLTSEAKAMGKPSDNFSVLTSAANASRGKAKIDELINSAKVYGLTALRFLINELRALRLLRAVRLLIL